MIAGPLQPFEIVEVDDRIAQSAADIGHATRIAPLGVLILATAGVNGAILVTRTIGDFPATMPGTRVPYSI